MLDAACERQSMMHPQWWRRRRGEIFSPRSHSCVTRCHSVCAPALFPRVDLDDCLDAALDALLANLKLDGEI